MPGNPISQEEMDAAFFSFTSQPPATESVDTTNPPASMPSDAPAAAQPLMSVPQFAPALMSFDQELESAVSSLTGQPTTSQPVAGPVAGSPRPGRRHSPGSASPSAASPAFQQYSAVEPTANSPTVPSADDFSATGSAGHITQNVPGRPGSSQSVQGHIDNIATSFERESAALDAAGMDAARQRDDLSARFAEMLQAERIVRDDERVAEQEMLDGIRQEAEQLRSLRIDPARLYRDRGAGVSMAVGIAVNAAQNTMLNILYPGSNPANTALQLVTAAVDRDVAAQVANIDLARAGLQDQIGLADRTHALFEDRRATAEYIRAKQLEQAGLEMTASAARISSIQGRESALRAAEQLRLQADRSMQAAMTSLAQRRVARGPRPTLQAPGYNQDLQIASGYILRSSNPYIKARIDAWRAAHHGQDPSLSDLQSQLGLTNDDIKQMRSFSDMEGALRGVLDAVNNDALSMTSLTPATAAAKARLASALGRYTTAFSQANGLGAMDDGVRAIVSDIAGLPEESWRGMATADRARIRAHVSGLINGVRSQARRFATDSFGGAVSFDEQMFHSATQLPSDDALPGGRPGEVITTEEAPDEATAQPPLGSRVLAAIQYTPLGIGAQAIEYAANALSGATESGETTDPASLPFARRGAAISAADREQRRLAAERNRR